MAPNPPTNPTFDNNDLGSEVFYGIPIENATFPVSTLATGQFRQLQPISIMNLTSTNNLTGAPELDLTYEIPIPVATWLFSISGYFLLSITGAGGNTTIEMKVTVRYATGQQADKVIYDQTSGNGASNSTYLPAKSMAELIPAGAKLLIELITLHTGTGNTQLFNYFNTLGFSWIRVVKSALNQEAQTVLSNRIS